MRMPPFISIVILGSLFLMTACAWPKLGVVSVKPVETGREYELVTATSSASHSRPVLFGVVFGEYKSYAQMTGEAMQNAGCDVMKDVELKYQMMQYAGFGQEVTGIQGKCFKLKGRE
jgi:hypothetical protein